MLFLSALFGVRPGEGRLVGALLLHAVLLGTFRIFVDTAAGTLFLIHFESTYLPYIYIFVAILLPLIGLLYQRLAARLTFARLAFGSFAALFFSLLVFRLWFAIGDPRWSAFGFYVWSFAIAMLISLEFWGLAGQLLNVEQSKRLFSLISLGELFSIIPIGVAMPALTVYLRTPDLLWLANGAMAGMLALLVWFARTFRAELTTAQDADADSLHRLAPDSGLAPIFKSRYIRSIMGLMCLFTLTFYLLDANFYTLLQKRYATETEIAQFIGWYYALDSVLVLLANLVASRFLTRFGIRTSLFILPATLLIGGAAIVLASLWGAPIALVFTLAFWTKLAESAVRFSLNGSATLVLYQPLPAKTRVQAQTAVEGIIEPITGGLAGVGLILFEKFLGFEPVLLALTMAVFILPWFGVAFEMGRGYTQALLRALNKRQFGDGAPLLNDLTSADLLWQKLADPHPTVVIYVLTLLEEMRHPKLSTALQQVLAHPAPEVRREALRRLEGVGDVTTRPAIRQRLAVEDDPEVRGAAVRTLAMLDEPEPTNWAMPYLEDPARAVRLGATIGLLRSGELSGIVLAGEQLLTWLKSSEVAERVMAAQVLGEVGERGFDRHLLPLFHDPEPAVRRAAFLAAGQIQSPRLRPLLLAALTGHDVQAAQTALLVSGAAILPDVKTILTQPDTPPTTRMLLARLLGRIHTSDATDLLLTQLANPDINLRQQVLAALVRQGYGARAEDSVLFQHLMQLEGQRTARLLSARLDVTPDDADRVTPPMSLLQTALDEELRQSQARLFFVLRLLYEPSAIQRVQDNLTHSARSQQAYALEALETLLRVEHRPLVLAWLDPTASRGRGHKLQPFFPTPLLGRVERLRELAHSQADTPWVRACALWALQDNAAEQAVGEAWAQADLPHIVRDTAQWLQNPTTVGEKPMLAAIEKVLILKSINFFASTPDHVLAELARLLVEVELAAHQRLCSKGDAGDSLYIIVSGRVRVHDGPRLIRYYGERAIVGEMAVLDTEPRTADVTIEEDALLLRLDQSALYELMADHVEVAQGIIRFLLRRMRVLIRESAEAQAHNQDPLALTGPAVQLPL